jgi:hypothetical protein
MIMHDKTHIRSGHPGHTADFPELFGDQPRAELPEALPDPSVRVDRLHDPLGEPLTVHEVAKLIGCSAWTVRHRYLSAGIPHIRTGPTGKLIFYKNQIIRWLLREQQKGG